MKLYVLTICYENCNFRPSIFKTEKEAQEQMEYEIEYLVSDTNNVAGIETYTRSAFVRYDDNTTSVLQIFEVEI